MLPLVRLSGPSVLGLDVSRCFWTVEWYSTRSQFHVCDNQSPGIHQDVLLPPCQFGCSAPSFLAVNSKKDRTMTEWGLLRWLGLRLQWDWMLTFYLLMQQSSKIKTYSFKPQIFSLTYFFCFALFKLLVCFYLSHPSHLISSLFFCLTFVLSVFVHSLLFSAPSFFWSPWQPLLHHCFALTLPWQPLRTQSPW